MEPPSSPKKEKHKHKDKKKKRRRDSEANGEPRPHDKDKRSKKDHRVGHSKDLPSLANGSLSETKASTSVAVHENTLQVLQANNYGEKVLADGGLANNRKGLEPSCMVDSQIPLISLRATGSSNGAAAKDIFPSSKVVSEIEDELNRQRRVEFMPHVEKVWSAVDDQEWLFLCDNQLRLGEKERLAGETPHVWAEAILLPSVGIYALPYVVPD